MERGETARAVLVLSLNAQPSATPPRAFPTRAATRAHGCAHCAATSNSCSCAGFAQKLRRKQTLLGHVCFLFFCLAVGGWRTGSFFRGKTGQSAKHHWRADWVPLGMFTCPVNIPPAILDFEAKLRRGCGGAMDEMKRCNMNPSTGKRDARDAALFQNLAGASRRLAGASGFHERTVALFARRSVTGSQESGCGYRKSGFL
jgi:hypothetical protein